MKKRLEEMVVFQEHLDGVDMIDGCKLTYSGDDSFPISIKRDSIRFKFGEDKCSISALVCVALNVTHALDDAKECDRYAKACYHLQRAYNELVRKKELERKTRAFREGRS